MSDVVPMLTTVKWDVVCVEIEGDAARFDYIDLAHPSVWFDRSQLGRLDFWPQVGQRLMLHYERTYGDNGHSWIRPVGVYVGAHHE